MAEGKTTAAQLDPAWLKGLKYRSSEGKAVEKDGRKVMEYRVVERDLRPGDVLAFKDYGSRAVIVTADGQKVEVKK